MPYDQKANEKRAKKYPRYGGRKVSEDILDQVLGKDKIAVSNRQKGGRAEIQKKSMLKGGRNQAGMKNPRGGRNLSEDMPSQMKGGVGTHPEEGPQTAVQKGVISRVLGNENKKKYDRAELMKQIAAGDEKKKAYKDKKSKGKPAMYKSRKEREEDSSDEPDDDSDDK